MAGLSTEIIVRNELRPCWYKHTQKAMFHKWCDIAQVLEPSPLVYGHKGGQICYTYALIELQTGEMAKARPEDIIFADDKFSDSFFVPPYEQGECEK